MNKTKGIKKVFIDNKKSKQIKTRKPVLKPIDKYKEILFISDTEKNHLLTEITSIFKQAKISYLYSRTNKEDNSTTGIYTYHSSDFSLIGKIKNENLIQMLSINFDLVLDFSSFETLNQYLLKNLNYSFMIGKSNTEKSKMYDLLIENKLNDTEFIQAIKQNITLLSQNGNN